VITRHPMIWWRGRAQQKGRGFAVEHDWKSYWKRIKIQFKNSEDLQKWRRGQTQQVKCRRFKRLVSGRWRKEKEKIEKVTAKIFQLLLLHCLHLCRNQGPLHSVRGTPMTWVLCFLRAADHSIFSSVLFIKKAQVPQQICAISGGPWQALLCLQCPRMRNHPIVGQERGIEQAHWNSAPRTCLTPFPSLTDAILCIHRADYFSQRAGEEWNWLWWTQEEDGTYSEGEEVEESENSDDEHDDAHDRGAFERRNHAKELDEVCLKFAQEQTCQLTDLEKAMMFLRKITLLHQIPHSVADALLDPEAIKKLTLLSGMTMQLIDRKLAKVYVTGGHTVTLGSGTRIRYLPLTLSFLRKKLTQPDLGGEIILYWDGFRQFRAKGGSLGKNFFLCFSSSSFLFNDPSQYFPQVVSTLEFFEMAHLKLKISLWWPCCQRGRPFQRISRKC